MFSFKGILQSCGSGCQLLWSDPNKQAYGVVEKEESDPHEENPEEEDPLAPDDIVTSQPIWSERPSIVKNMLPYQRLSTPNLTEATRPSTVMGSSPSTSKKEEVSKSISNIFKQQQQQQQQQKKTSRSSSVHDPSAAFVFSSPIVKSKSITGINMPSRKSGNTFKSTRKQKSEEVRLQIVSVV